MLLRFGREIFAPLTLISGALIKVMWNITPLGVPMRWSLPPHCLPYLPQPQKLTITQAQAEWSNFLAGYLPNWEVYAVFMQCFGCNKSSYSIQQRKFIFHFLFILFFLNMKLYIHSNFELIKGFHAQQILSRRSNLHILRYSAYCTLVRNFIYWKFTHFVFIRSKLQEYLRKIQTNLSGILLPHTLLRIFHINTQWNVNAVHFP